MQHTVAAELVASVLNVQVVSGDKVEPMDELVVLESMRMEIPVLAEAQGVVAEVVVNVGDVVHDGDPLVIITTL